MLILMCSCAFATWSSLVAFNGSPSAGAQNIAVGGGVVGDSAVEDVWLFMNKSVNTGGGVYQNQTWWSHFDCTDAGCATLPASVSWSQPTNATRSGSVPTLNTAPSLCLDPDLDQLHLLFNSDDSSCTTGSAGAQNAQFSEDVYSTALAFDSSLVIESDATCDGFWAHGLMGRVT